MEGEKDERHRDEEDINNPTDDNGPAGDSY